MVGGRIVERVRVVVPLRGNELVVADPRRQNEVGVHSGVARYPTRRDFLRRLKVGPEECTLEWLSPVRLTVPPGTPLELRVAVDADPVEQVQAEVLRVHQEGRAPGTRVVVRATGLGRAGLASVYARASGRPAEQGFRGAPRVPLELKARYAYAGLSGRGELLDLSRGGARLHVGGPLLPAPGAGVELELRTGFLRRDRLVARVAWSSEERHCFGVEFVEVRPEVQRRLVKLR